MQSESWPELSYENGKETYHTIHLWSQIAGKIKLVTMPWINHSWHITLFVTSSGLTTGALSSNGKNFHINLNFLNHRLEVITSKNEEKAFSLLSMSVARCYSVLLATLKDMGIEVNINPMPNEMENPIPFDKNEQNIYLPEIASALHLSLLKANEIFTKFRAGFIGKSSPVHFFWGSFDLAVSRFSGRTAPPHPGGIPNLPDWVAREAYSHEVSSCGFWPGNEAMPEAAFYSYIYPEPEGYKQSVVKPDSAYYHKDLREFILPYEAVRQSKNPGQTLMDFLNSTYETAANLAGWERNKLEKQLKGPGRKSLYDLNL
jgi:hypothetical protein